MITDIEDQLGCTGHRLTGGVDSILQDHIIGRWDPIWSAHPIPADRGPIARKAPSTATATRPSPDQRRCASRISRSSPQIPTS